MKRFITQQHASGCAVAAVATIANTSYSKALSFFKNGEFRAQLRGFYCKEIVKALQKVGLFYTYHHITNKNHKKIYTNKAIVFIRRSKKYPQGHYVARHNNRWKDSWLNYPSILNVTSGYRRRLPGTPIYMILPIKK